MDISEKIRTFVPVLSFLSNFLLLPGRLRSDTWPLFYVVEHIFTRKNCKKSKKMKKNAKKFAYIKKKLYLCTRFRKDTRNNTKK